MLELNFHPFPDLETERLLLRKIDEGDIDMLLRLRSDINVMRYIDRPIAKTREDVLPLYNKMKETAETNTGISWVITLKETGEMIGQVGFWRIDQENHRGEIGYMLRPEFFGKGLVSEAIKATLTHAFRELKFHSVEANVNTGNLASIKILEKHGFVKEAHFRENYYFDGKFLDSAIYCILASDWSY